MQVGNFSLHKSAIPHPKVLSRVPVLFYLSNSETTRSDCLTRKPLVLSHQSTVFWLFLFLIFSFSRKKLPTVRLAGWLGAGSTSESVAAGDGGAMADRHLNKHISFVRKTASRKKEGYAEKIECFTEECCRMVHNWMTERKRNLPLAFYFRFHTKYAGFESYKRLATFALSLYENPRSQLLKLTSLN